MVGLLGEAAAATAAGGRPDDGGGALARRAVVWGSRTSGAPCIVVALLFLSLSLSFSPPFSGPRLRALAAAALQPRRALRFVFLDLSVSSSGERDDAGDISRFISGQETEMRCVRSTCAVDFRALRFERAPSCRTFVCVYVQV